MLTDSGGTSDMWMFLGGEPEKMAGIRRMPHFPDRWGHTDHEMLEVLTQSEHASDTDVQCWTNKLDIYMRGHTIAA